MSITSVGDRVSVVSPYCDLCGTIADYFPYFAIRFDAFVAHRHTPIPSFSQPTSSVLTSKLEHPVPLLLSAMTSQTTGHRESFLAGFASDSIACTLTSQRALLAIR